MMSLLLVGEDAASDASSEPVPMTGEGPSPGAMEEDESVQVSEYGGGGSCGSIADQEGGGKNGIT